MDGNIISSNSSAHCLSYQGSPLTPPQWQLPSPCLPGGWTGQLASISACKSSVLYAALVMTVATLVIREVLPSGSSGHTPPAEPSAPRPHLQPLTWPGSGGAWPWLGPLQGHGDGWTARHLIYPRGSMALEIALEPLTQKNLGLTFPSTLSFSLSF